MLELKLGLGFILIMQASCWSDGFELC